MIKKVKKYFMAHPHINSLAHALIGVGVGILLNPVVGIHPVRWAGTLILMGLALHIYPLFAKK